MTAQDAILEAQRLIGRLWGEAILRARKYPGMRGLHPLVHIRDRPGLPVEDFRQRQVPGSPTQAGLSHPGPTGRKAAGTANLRELLARTQGFFNQLLSEPGASKEQGPLRAFVDAVDYTVLTGELDALEEHLRRLEAGSPPSVVAAFGTLEEAEAWLKSQAEPPDRAWVRSAGEFHLAVNHSNVARCIHCRWPRVTWSMTRLKPSHRSMTEKRSP